MNLRQLWNSDSPDTLNILKICLMGQLGVKDMTDDKFNHLLETDVPDDEHEIVLVMLSDGYQRYMQLNGTNQGGTDV